MSNRHLKIEATDVMWQRQHNEAAKADPSIIEQKISAMKKQKARRENAEKLRSVRRRIALIDCALAVLFIVSGSLLAHLATVTHYL